MVKEDPKLRYNKEENTMARYCNKCGKKMFNGFCIDSGLEYYCSEECLYSCMTEEEYLELYESDAAYWTEWEEEDDDEE